PATDVGAGDDATGEHVGDDLGEGAPDPAHRRSAPGVELADDMGQQAAAAGVHDVEHVGEAGVTAVVRVRDGEEVRLGVPVLLGRGGRRAVERAQQHRLVAERRVGRQVAQVGEVAVVHGHEEV